MKVTKHHKDSEIYEATMAMIGETKDEYIIF
jgi:hypothetical protein